MFRRFTFRSFQAVNLRLSYLMNKSKIPSWILAYSVGILILAFCLLVLGAVSNSFFQSGLAEQSEYPYVARTRIKGAGYPPVFAYWIYGTSGENKKVMRLLKAVYHPRNRYLLQLDASSSDHERRRLALSVKSEKIFQAFRNVDVVGSSNALHHMGVSVLASTLHAAALFLKISRDWDWFIPLNASDYPLITQDDLLHAFTYLPRDLNLIRYLNNNDQKEEESISQIIVDPSLHVQKKSPILYASKTRAKPEAFKVFHGSSRVILTRNFIEYCIKGWDNLPRILLMYLTNVVRPLEFYFHTTLCNSPKFQNTSINTNLRYFIRDTTPKQESPFITLSHFKNMPEGGTAFAGPFEEHDQVLQKLDEDILKLSADGVVTGKWCSLPAMNQSTESSNSKPSSCTNWGNINAIKPSPTGLKLQRFLSKLAAKTSSRSSQCYQK